MLAALNHPNIATVFGFEESDDLHGLVMELVPGQTLAERLVTGAIPADETVQICAEIARRARCSASEGNHPPGYQDSEHHGHARGTREDPRLRVGEASRRQEFRERSRGGDSHQDDASGSHSRNTRVYESGAAAR
jgi:hypothetical protein